MTDLNDTPAFERRWRGETDLDPNVGYKEPPLRRLLYLLVAVPEVWPQLLRIAAEQLDRREIERERRFELQLSTTCGNR